MDLESASHAIDDAYLQQFNALQKSGALDDLAALRRENRVLDTLINDGARLYGLKSVEEIIDFVIERMLDQFIPTYFLIIIEPLRGHDLMQYCYANLKPSDDRLSASTYAVLKERLVSSPYITEFAALDLPGEPQAELARFEPELLVPMNGIEGTFGLAIIGRKVLDRTYSDTERMYVDKLARFVSIGIQNNLHRESAITDAKTGLYNHAYFNQRLEQEIARVLRHKGKAGVIMLDVDHFKIFNDTYGHLAGDEVLTALARTIKDTVRSEDVAARFGGEEFCTLAIECDGPGLLDMSERIRLAVERMGVVYKGQSLSVTASLGCCLLDTDIVRSPDDYIEMADKALYSSKSGGRNRSTLYRASLLGRARAM